MDMIKGRFKVNLSTQISGSDLIKLREAVDLWERVFNSEEFKREVESYSYTEKRCNWFRCKTVEKRGFYHWANDPVFSNVYEYILKGKETLNPKENGIADIEVRIDETNKKGIIGFTYPSVRWQAIYRYWFSKSSAASIASNLCHEWLHKAGFGHSYKYTNMRKHSVPYAVGYIVERLAKKL